MHSDVPRSLSIFEPVANLACDLPSPVRPSLPSQPPNEIPSQIGDEDLALLGRVKDDLMGVWRFLTLVVERKKGEGENEDLIRGGRRREEQAALGVEGEVSD